METARYFLSVLAVVGALYAVLFVLKRKGIAQAGAGFRRARANRRLEVLERAALTSNNSLYLVRFVDRAILLAVSPGSCTVLQTGALADFARPPLENIGATDAHR